MDNCITLPVCQLAQLLASVLLDTKSNIDKIPKTIISFISLLKQEKSFFVSASYNLQIKYPIGNTKNKIEQPKNSGSSIRNSLIITIKKRSNTIEKPKATLLARFLPITIGSVFALIFKSPSISSISLMFSLIKVVIKVNTQLVNRHRDHKEGRKSCEEKFALTFKA